MLGNYFVGGCKKEKLMYTIQIISRLQIYTTNTHIHSPYLTSEEVYVSTLMMSALIVWFALTKRIQPVLKEALNMLVCFGLASYLFPFAMRRNNLVSVHSACIYE